MIFKSIQVWILLCCHVRFMLKVKWIGAGAICCETCCKWPWRCYFFLKVAQCFLPLVVSNTDLTRFNPHRPHTFLPCPDFIFLPERFHHSGPALMLLWIQWEERGKKNKRNKKQQPWNLVSMTHPNKLHEWDNCSLPCGYFSLFVAPQELLGKNRNETKGNSVKKEV